MRVNPKVIFETLKDHSGTICAGLAVVGTGATAYLSGKAAVRVYCTIDPDMDRKTKAKEYFKAYWKTGVAFILTTASIIGSDRIHVKQLKEKVAAATGIAAMWRGKYIKLDQKMEEKLGHEAANDIRREIVEDEMKENPYDGPLPDEDSDEILVYEPYTNQYIPTTEKKLTAALWDVNKELTSNFEVDLNFIIDRLGGKPDPVNGKLGWNYDNAVQSEAWSYYGGPWIEPIKDVYKEIGSDPGPLGYLKKGVKPGKNCAIALLYEVNPETQRPEDMISYGQ